MNCPNLERHAIKPRGVNIPSCPHHQPHKAITRLQHHAPFRVQGLRGAGHRRRGRWKYTRQSNLIFPPRHALGERPAARLDPHTKQRPQRQIRATGTRAEPCPSCSPLAPYPIPGCPQPNPTPVSAVLPPVADSLCISQFNVDVDNGVVGPPSPPVVIPPDSNPPPRPWSTNSSIGLHQSHPHDQHRNPPPRDPADP